MREKIKQYFLDMSNTSDEFGGVYPANEVTSMGVFAGLLLFPVVCFVVIIALPLRLIAHFINKL